MADIISSSQKTVKSERNGSRSIPLAWNRMLLAGGLAILVPLGACAPRTMYRTDNIIEVLIRTSSEKNSVLHIGESRATDGYEVTLTDVLPSCDNVPPNAVFQVSHDIGGEQSLVQVGFREGQTKQMRMLDGTILEIRVNGIQVAPNRSESSARFIARKFKPDE